MKFAPLAWSVIALSLCQLGHAQPSTSPKDAELSPKRAFDLAPQSTLAILQVRSFPTFVAQFKEGSSGRLLNDPEVAPLTKAIWQGAEELFQEQQSELGITLEGLIALPKGEICWILLEPREDDSRIPWALLVDMGPNPDDHAKWQSILDRVIDKQGWSRSYVEVAGQRATRVEISQDDSIILTFRDDRLCFGNEAGLARLFQPSPNEPLGGVYANPRFGPVAVQTDAGPSSAANVVFFINPIDLARSWVKDNFLAQAGLTMIPVLGLDGVLAGGGSLSPSGMNVGVSLDSPRSGLLDLLAPGAVELVPEPWVPGGVASLTAIQWEMSHMYQAASRVANGFGAEGWLQNRIESAFRDRADLDFEKEVLPSLSGRITMTAVVTDTTKINGQAQLVGIGLRDGKAFSQLLPKMHEKMGERLQKRDYRGVTYYTAPLDAPSQPNLRTPQPSFAIIGDSFVFSDSEDVLKKAIDSQQNPSDRLSQQPDWKLTLSKLKEKLAGRSPCIFVFARNDESWRSIHSWASNPELREQIARGNAETAWYKKLDKALKEHPLPPYEKLRKYLLPAGGFVTINEKGVFYSAFDLESH